MVVPVNPVTVGAAVKYVGAAWNILSGGGGLSRAESEAVDAAKQAGYSTGVRGYRDPQGRVVSQREVIAAGRRAQIVLPDSPPLRPSDPGYRPDLTEKRVPPLKRPPVTPAPRVPRVPGRLGRVIEGVTTVAGGILGSEAILRGIPEIITRIPQPAPPSPQPPAPQLPAYASPTETIGGRSPFYRTPGVKTPPPPAVARPVPAPQPVEPVAPITPGVLTPIDIFVGRIPFPSAPAPASPPAPTATSRTILGLTPAQLASIAVPTLLALLAGRTTGRGRAPGVSDPLTVPQTPPGFPLPTIPGLGLTPGSFPLPWPGGGGLSFGGGSQTGQCECPPKRKRKPKSKRDVCYSGRYIERASGLSKTKLRKVPCR